VTSLWREIDGTVGIWTMQGGEVASTSLIGVAASGWQTAGVGDFYGNGTDDILWENSSAGLVDIWTIQNGQAVSTSQIGIAASGWQVAGVGDFNGDGTDDILWQNPGTGLVDIWTMQNGQAVATSQIGVAAPGWQFAGVGDYFGNGTDDILWENSNAGLVDIWGMTNGAVSSTSQIGVAASGWGTAPPPTEGASATTMASFDFTDINTPVSVSDTGSAVAGSFPTVASGPATMLFAASASPPPIAIPTNILGTPTG
jgi:FG-GAP-like repeat